MLTLVLTQMMLMMVVTINDISYASISINNDYDSIKNDNDDNTVHIL